jgi:hypothetical protein
MPLHKIGDFKSGYLSKLISLFSYENYIICQGFLMNSSVFNICQKAILIYNESRQNYFKRV